MKRLPTFGEEPIGVDYYIPGSIPARSRFHPSTIEESEEYGGPTTRWASEWVIPKAVKGIPGDSLAVYNRDRFREVSKERAFRRLRMIPSPTQEPELTSFGKRRFGFGTLGQGASSVPEYGEWGELWSPLVTGVSKWFDIETKKLEAQRLAELEAQKKPVISPYISQAASTWIPIAIIAGVAFLMMRKRGKGGRTKVRVRRRERRERPTAPAIGG